MTHTLEDSTHKKEGQPPKSGVSGVLGNPNLISRDPPREECGVFVCPQNSRAVEVFGFRGPPQKNTEIWTQFFVMDIFIGFLLLVGKGMFEQSIKKGTVCIFCWVSEVR